MTVYAGDQETAAGCRCCGGPLIPGGTSRLCPRCLLRAALEPPEEAADKPPPARLGGYELLGEIARGGMGVVYKARQYGLNRLCALKVVTAGPHANREFIERFRVEAQAAARLSHPNIVAIYDVGEDDGRQFYSMELIEGENLGRWKAAHHLSPDECAKLLRQLAETAHFAHQRGVLHRDLKPQNILMDAAGQPRITDFGLAKQVEETREITMTGAGFGTPGYAAPEQACGRHALVGPASDVYSLGAVLYFLLTDRAPHAAATALETFRRSLEEPPMPPRRFNPKIPRDLETICLKCLEKDPERRYGSGRALAEDLGRFLDRLPLQARRAGPIWHTWIWARSHPWAITGLASLLQLAMIGLAYGLWQETRYLQWLLDHPREPTPFDTLLIFSPSYASLLIYICMLSGYLPLKDLRVRIAEGRALERVDVTRCTMLGVAFAGTGVWLLLRCIEGFVWKYDHAWHVAALALVPPFCFFWFGSIIGLKALRGYNADRNAADVIAAQLGSPIRTTPVRFLGTLLAALGLLAPASWLVLGTDEGHRFLYLLTNVVLLLLGLSFWRAARDEMRAYWQFLACAMFGLSAELSLQLSPGPVVVAIGIGAAVASLAIWRANVALGSN